MAKAKEAGDTQVVTTPPSQSEIDEAKKNILEMVDTFFPEGDAGREETLEALKPLLDNPFAK